MKSASNSAQEVIPPGTSTAQLLHKRMSRPTVLSPHNGNLTCNCSTTVSSGRGKRSKTPLILPLRHTGSTAAMYTRCCCAACLPRRPMPLCRRAHGCLKSITANSTAPKLPPLRQSLHGLYKGAHPVCKTNDTAICSNNAAYTAYCGIFLCRSPFSALWPPCFPPL